MNASLRLQKSSVINYTFRSRNRLVMASWVSLIQISHPGGLLASTKISLTVFKFNSSLTVYVVKETLKNTELEYESRCQSLHMSPKSLAIITKKSFEQIIQICIQIGQIPIHHRISTHCMIMQYP